MVENNLDRTRPELGSADTSIDGGGDTKCDHSPSFCVGQGGSREVVEVARAVQLQDVKREGKVRRVPTPVPKFDECIAQD